MVERVHNAYSLVISALKHNMCHRWTIIWLVPTLLRDHSIPLYIMDIFETINHAQKARDVPPTPSDDYGRNRDPIENRGRVYDRFDTA